MSRVDKRKDEATVCLKVLDYHVDWEGVEHDEVAHKDAVHET